MVLNFKKSSKFERPEAPYADTKRYRTGEAVVWSAATRANATAEGNKSNFA
jgi:hypothetical protein